MFFLLPFFLPANLSRRSVSSHVQSIYSFFPLWPISFQDQTYPSAYSHCAVRNFLLQVPRWNPASCGSPSSSLERGEKKGLLEQSRGSLSIPKLQRSRILPSGGRLQSLCTTVSSDEHVQDYLIRPPCPYPSAIWTPFLSDPFPSKYVDLYLERYVPRLSVEPDRKKRPQIRD